MTDSVKCEWLIILCIKCNLHVNMLFLSKMRETKAHHTFNSHLIISGT